MSESNGAFNGRYRNVSAAQPCEICGKPDWCSTTEDGDVAFCRRKGDPSQQKTDKNGDTYYYHRLKSLPPSYEPCYRLEDGGGRLADPDIRDKVYTALLSKLTLFGQHEKALNGRGLKMGLLAAGYRTLPEKRRYKAVRELIEAGFEEYLPNVPGFFVAMHEGKYWTVSGAAGLLIPVRDTQQRIVALLCRPNAQMEGGKYRWLSSKKRGGPGPGAPIHVPVFKGDKSTVRITEGALKADIATKLSGVLTIGLPGVNSGSRVPAILDELGAKVARVALDSDADRNTAVGAALYNLVRTLLDKGYTVELEQWNGNDGKGIDDLLAAGHQPRLIQGEKVPLVAQGIAELAGAFNRPGSAPSDTTKPNEGGRHAVDIIRDYLRQYYHPTFRRGAVFYSDSLAREIRASEACFAPDSQLVDKLCLACDCPKNEHGIIRGAIPKLFKTWGPVAWRDILDKLPEEEATAEVVGSAAEEFRARVAAGLHTHVVLGYRHQGTEETSVERRSLIAWAALFAWPAKGAAPGKWAQVRNYLLWCRRDEAKGPLRIALRVGLFASGQAHLRNLAESGQYRFAQLCELYSVGTAQRACGQRVVELASEFIAELLATPVVETAEQSPEQPPSREPGEEG